MDTNDVLIRALSLGPGHRIRLKFETARQMDTMRMRLIREKKALLAVYPDLAKRIFVSSRRSNFEVIVTLDEECLIVIEDTNTGEILEYLEGKEGEELSSEEVNIDAEV